MFLRTVFLLIIIFTITSVGKSAYAEDTDFRPVLRCSEEQSIFMIQFGLFNQNGTRKSLTQSIMPMTDLWTELTPAEDGVCRFKRGQSITLRYNGDYKDGGFTLQISDSFAYKRKAFFSENEAGIYDLNTTIVFQLGPLKDGTLTECRKVEHKDHEFAILCNSETRRIDLDEQDRVRLHRQSVAKKRGIIDGELSPFCESLKPLNLKNTYTNTRPPNEFEIDFLKFEEKRKYGLHANFSDINDDGKIDLIYQEAGSSESFYGSFLAIFLDRSEFNTAFEEDFRLSFKSNDQFKSGIWAKNLFSGGMAGSSVRYVYNHPLRLNGKSYIYTSEEISKKIPSEILYEVNIDGSKTPVCIYP